MGLNKDNIAFGRIANALESTASDHILGIAEDIYDVTNGDYQNNINTQFKTKLSGIEDGANKYTHPLDGTNVGSFGQATDATPNFGASFKVPLVTVNSLGHITNISNKTVTLPSYSNATTTSNGLMSSADKSKLNGIEAGANKYVHPTAGANTGSFGTSSNSSPSHGGTFNIPYITVDSNGHVTSASNVTITLPSQYTYTLPTAATNTLGGIKTGYTPTGRNYAVVVDANGNAYVNVPWTDTNTNTTYTAGAGLTLSSNQFKAHIKSETKSSLAATAMGTTSGKQYAVGLDSTGYLSVNIPWTDTNTKVTAVGNHYTPSADTNSELSANASGASAAWSIDVVKGVKLQRDAKGHVTGITVESGKIPANPNVDTKVTQTIVSDNKEYPLLLAPSGQTTTQTTTANFDSAAVTLNPSTDLLTTKGIKATSNVTLYTASGDSPSLIFQRGTTTDSSTDWRMHVTSGKMRLQNNISSAGWVDVFSFTSPDNAKELSSYYHILPGSNNSLNLGSASYKWAGVYATSIISDGLTVNNQTQNCVLAAPSSSNGNATFRKLVKADLPSLTASDVGAVATGTKASSSSLGLIKTGYSTSGKNYAVVVDTNGNAYVNVPWTDTNTTYTANNGLVLNGTVFGANLRNTNKSVLGTPTTIHTVSDRQYGVFLDKDGYLSVNIPWKTNSAGAGLIVTDLLEMKASLKSETKSSLTATAMGSTSGKQYAVGLDKDGYLSVNIPWTDSNTDTKNTAGSSNTSSKLFLIGATSQAANPQTYSHDTAYVGTDGCLYSNSTKVSVEGHGHTIATQAEIESLF